MKNLKKKLTFVMFIACQIYREPLRELDVRDRILGGELAELNEFPWMVSMNYLNVRFFNEFLYIFIEIQNVGCSGIHRQCRLRSNF